MVFIRAPIFQLDGSCDSVKVVARVERDGKDLIVGVIQDGRVLATSFHPELTDDLRMHEIFLKIVQSCLSNKE